MSDGSFSGDSTMTRAQSCTVSIRMLDLINPSTNSNNSTTTDEKPNSDATVGSTTGAGLTLTPKTGDFNGNSNSNVTSWNIADTGNKTGTLSNGKAITEANIQEIISVLRKQLPTGTTWAEYMNNNNRYDNPGSSVKSILSKYQASTNYGCGGFAAMVSDAIFGKSANPGRLLTDTSKIRTGDIVVRVRTSTGVVSHVNIVTSTSGNMHTSSDGNDADKITWDCATRENTMYSNNNSLANPYYTFYVYTRYPT